MSPKGQATAGGAVSGNTSSKKLKLARNVVNLMPLPPPIQIPPELIDKNDKRTKGRPDMITTKSDLNGRQEAITNPNEHEYQVISPPVHHRRIQRR